MDICNYLKSWPKQFVSSREICRRASGKKRSAEDPYWANQPLMRLVEKGILETDAAGHYRMVQKTKSDKPKRWVSPQIKKILEESGKKFEEISEPDSQDDLFK